MARILVAWATKRGSTAGVAEAVASVLNGAGLEAKTACFTRGRIRGRRRTPPGPEPEPKQVEQA